MTVCIHDSLARGVFLVMSNLQSEKIGFSRGVALPYVPMTVYLGEGGIFGHVKSAVIQKWCSVLVRTHEILAGGGGPPILHTKTRRTD